MITFEVPFFTCAYELIHYVYLTNFQHEIEKALPSAGNSGSVSGNPIVNDLKKMMEEVEALKAEREVIENELKESKFDMGKCWLPGLLLSVEG